MLDVRTVQATWIPCFSALQILRSAHLNQIHGQTYLQDPETGWKFDCIWVWKLCTG